VSRKRITEGDCGPCAEAIKNEVAEEVVERVLKDMIHEIKNPMTQIGGFANRNLRDLESGELSEGKIIFPAAVVEKIKKRNGIIQREMVRLGNILDTSADFVSHQKLNLQKIDLHSIFWEMIDLERDERIRIFMNFDLKKEVVIDREKIKMLILNLLINAKEAILDSPRRHKGVIRVKTWAGERQALFEISNNGNPIPENDIGRIFNPLFTTKENGSGVGLAISKAIVKAHKGNIEAKSSPDWTSFKISLPLYF